MIEHSVHFVIHLSRFRMKVSEENLGFEISRSVRKSKLFWKEFLSDLRTYLRNVLILDFRFC